jgi:penicillin-binding protein 2
MNERRKKHISKTWNREINPDEIFLDSKNLPQFDTQQFEGRIEKPITKRTVAVLGIFFLMFGGVFISRVWFLQIAEGDIYTARSENNHLDHIPIFASRGVIYDRNNVELAWNSLNSLVTGSNVPERSYIDKKGFGHLLGYVSYPSKDNNGFFYQEDFVGKSGVEKYYNNLLAGKNGIKLVEVDALGNKQSESTIEPPHDGKNLKLSIDSRIQEKLYSIIEQVSADRGFTGGAGVIMNVHTGNVLALTSFPEYSSSVLSNGNDAQAINRYLHDSRKPFLNRVVSGLYTPGSIVKPYVALGALNEKVIDAEKKILSTGSISIQNPYYPDIKSVFMDWRPQGWVDMRDAIAVSSDVYFYEIGGGYENQKGLGIYNIDKYMRMFGISETTGIDLPGEEVGTIPSPEWKAENFNGEPWRLGDTYHTAIGQYGFQVTPIQMVRGMAAIARGGILVTPHVLEQADGDPPVVPQEQTVDMNQDYFTVVREGMRKGVLGGTASALNTAGVSVAAKTGTAELGISKSFVNSWVTGFFPYENPRFAFAVVMEHGSRANLVGAPYVMRALLDWMVVNTPEYVK